MSLLMARIDDRLIHGQVVVGCCGTLRAHRVILCDETVASDDFQRRLYGAAVPSDIEIEFLGVDATAHRLEELSDQDRSTTIVVAGSCQTMRLLCESSSVVESICVGGLHHHDGAEEIWPGFFLSASELDCLRALLDLGLDIRVQSVPSNSPIDASERLRSGPVA